MSITATSDALSKFTPPKVPAAGVAGESMVALTLARAALEKFGGDSMVETKRNFAGYLDQLKNF